jgi:hypothetical protein
MVAVFDSERVVFDEFTVLPRFNGAIELRATCTGAHRRANGAVALLVFKPLAPAGTTAASRTFALSPDPMRQSVSPSKVALTVAALATIRLI